MGFLDIFDKETVTRLGGELIPSKGLFACGEVGGTISRTGDTIGISGVDDEAMEPGIFICSFASISPSSFKKVFFSSSQKN